MDIILLSTVRISWIVFSLCSALPCFLVGYYPHAETLRVIQVLSGVEHELLIQTESGAVTDPVAVERRKKKKKKNAAHR